MKKAVFLDRDGVINAEKNYVHNVEEFEFIDGIFDVCRYFQDRDYLLIVVTNQAGIARGYYTEDDFHTVSRWMRHEFEKNGIHINGIYFCPHHPEGTVERYRVRCCCRKPNPGMLFEARKDFDIDLERSILVGDKESDIQAGLNAGIKQNILVGKANSEIKKAYEGLVVVDSVRDVINRC